MTSSESKFLKRLIIILLIASLFPLGAFLYRVAMNAGSDSSSTIEPLITPAPDADASAFVPPTPTSYVVIVPNGWTEYTMPDQGFAISVPTTWQRLPVQVEELQAALQQVRQTNPELANALGARSAQLVQSGVKFWAFDLEPSSLESKFATNLTVTRQQLTNAVSFDTYVLVNVNQINGLSSRSGEVKQVRTTLANLPAEKVSYDLVLSSDDGSKVTTQITQYLILNGKEAFVLTYATRADEEDRYGNVFEQSARSWRLLEQ